MKKYICLILILYGVCSSGQTKALYNKSIEAYQNKDYAAFLEITKQLDSIRPHHPTFTYNLASAFSLNGRNAEAFLVLKRLILANNTVAFEEDADFMPLKELEGFQYLQDLKGQLSREVQNSRFKLSLSEKDLHPESVLYLHKHKLWLASSIRKAKIVAFDAGSGKCTDWLVDSRFAVFAMKADSKEDFLWIACAAVPETRGFTKEMEGTSEVLKVDLSTRKIVSRFVVDGNHVFGDLVVSKDNEVYVSDSAEPLIYKVSGEKISIWKDLRNTAFNLQGIAFNAKQTRLFVADYLKGIVTIDLKDGNHSWLKFPDDATTKGIDGLVFHNNSLVAIHNGVTPIRIVKYHLNGENTAITDFVVLDSNRPEFNEPALASVFKSQLYFFANAPWKLYDKNFVLDEAKLEFPKLFELSLE